MHEIAAQYGTIAIANCVISTIPSLDAALLELSERRRFGATMFRGHGVHTWSLKPEVFRAPYPEGSILLEFIARGASRMSSAPASGDMFGWLSLAQHYGLPTRLLDWTQSPLIGLYFAVENTLNDTEDGCLWALSISKLNSQMFDIDGLIATNSPFVNAVVEDAFRPGKLPADSAQAFAIGARENDLRMLVQQALFTLHRDATDLIAIKCETPHLCKFLIPRAAKAQLRMALQTYGVSRASVFPDLANLALEIKARSAAQRGPQVQGP